MSWSMIALCGLIYSLFLLLLFAPQRLTERRRERRERRA
jgi:hypothetical protein